MPGWAAALQSVLIERTERLPEGEGWATFEELRRGGLKMGRRQLYRSLHELLTHGRAEVFDGMARTAGGNVRQQRWYRLTEQFYADQNHRVHRPRR